jgi:hypothetical protein
MTNHINNFIETKIIMKIQFLQRENEILKELIKNGVFYMHYYSTDCDGVSVEKTLKFNSLNEFYEEEESQAEWADGAFYFKLITN